MTIKRIDLASLLFFLDTVYTLRYTKDMSNRQRILEIGLVLFAQNGYEATGVQEICDRAEITKPTLYHYFGNKQGLLESILEERFKPFLSLLESACHYRRDLTLNIQRVIEAYFLFASRDLQLYQLLLSLRTGPSRSESRQIIKPWIAAQEQAIMAMFKAAERQHGNMRGRSKAYMISLLGVINAYVQQALEDSLALDDELAQQARHQFMHGIFS